ncbi:MAG: c-type cytochrome [Anaerolineaceae bacterium]|nr:c-type cytochrome [Anaerolineaceae bacterium]
MIERMLIGRIENRVLVGVVAFLGIMIITGWVAINEGARMQAYQDLQLARSIENGAALFVVNCARCHSADGRGVQGAGPGLNNPQLFGYDFFPETTQQITELTSEKKSLQTERGLADTTDARKAEIDSRVSAIDSEIDALSTQVRTQVQPAVDKGYDPVNFSRLKNLGWVGTLDSFIFTTLVHGRPASAAYSTLGAMPAWSQTAGGPMRDDQLQDITNYILNWNRDWTLDDLFAVNHFAVQPVDPATFVATNTDPTIMQAYNNDVDAVVAALADVTGNPAAGETLYNGALGCAGCHVAGAGVVAPHLEGTYTRVVDSRLTLPQFQGYTAEKYLVESILLPDAFLAPPNYANAMLPNFAERLTLQNVADLVAFLETQNGPSPE